MEDMQANFDSYGNLILEKNTDLCRNTFTIRRQDDQYELFLMLKEKFGGGKKDELDIDDYRNCKITLQYWIARLKGLRDEKQVIPYELTLKAIENKIGD